MLLQEPAIVQQLVVQRRLSIVAILSAIDSPSCTPAIRRHADILRHRCDVCCRVDVVLSVQ